MDKKDESPLLRGENYEENFQDLAAGCEQAKYPGATEDHKLSHDFEQQDSAMEGDMFC